MKLPPVAWQVAFGAIAAACVYLLAQTDFDLGDPIRSGLQVLLVALAALKPPKA